MQTFSQSSYQRKNPENSTEENAVLGKRPAREIKGPPKGSTCDTFEGIREEPAYPQIHLQIYGLRELKCTSLTLCKSTKTPGTDALGERQRRRERSRSLLCALGKSLYLSELDFSFTNQKKKMEKDWPSLGWGDDQTK